MSGNPQPSRTDVTRFFRRVNDARRAQLTVNTSNEGLGRNRPPSSPSNNSNPSPTAAQSKRSPMNNRVSSQQDLLGGGNANRTPSRVGSNLPQTNMPSQVPNNRGGLNAFGQPRRYSTDSYDSSQPPSPMSANTTKSSIGNNASPPDQNEESRNSAFPQSSIVAQVSRTQPAPIPPQLPPRRDSGPPPATPSGSRRTLLPPQAPEHRGKVTLLLDVDETLVHASFTGERKHDIVLPIKLANASGNVYVAVRPAVRKFLEEIAPLFEIVIFTASLQVYADPLMDRIDPGRKLLGSLRLFRDSCTPVGGANVKDMSLLGRDLDRVAIVDNSPVAYMLQPRNAIPILSWFDDENDTELTKLLPMLRDLAKCTSVYDVLDGFNEEYVSVHGTPKHMGSPGPAKPTPVALPPSQMPQRRSFSQIPLTRVNNSSNNLPSANRAPPVSVPGKNAATFSRR